MKAFIKFMAFYTLAFLTVFMYSCANQSDSGDVVVYEKVCEDPYHNQSDGKFYWVTQVNQETDEAIASWRTVGPPISRDTYTTFLTEEGDRVVIRGDHRITWVIDPLSQEPLIEWPEPDTSALLKY